MKSSFWTRIVSINSAYWFSNVVVMPRYHYPAPLLFELRNTGNWVAISPMLCTWIRSIFCGRFAKRNFDLLTGCGGVSRPRARPH